MKTSEKLPVHGGEPADPAPARSGHGDTNGAHATELPGGLASSRDGYTLVPDDPTLGSGTFAFRIIGPDGAAVTAFDESHDRRLHLIVVRRDTTGFQHVHPEMDTAGTWRVPLAVSAGGVHRRSPTSSGLAVRP